MTYYSYTENQHSAGFNVETINHQGCKLEIWDISGKEKIVRLCDYLCNNSHYLILPAATNVEALLQEHRWPHLCPGQLR